MDKAKKISAIVIESQPLLLTGLSMMLSAAGIQVLAKALNQSEAVSIAKETQPHLILFSVSMPGVDNLITISALRGAAPGALILALISDDLPSEAGLALAYGAHRVLSKSARSEELLYAVRILLEMHRPASKD